MTDQTVTANQATEESQPEANTKVINIEVANPTSEEMREICENIKVNYDFSVTTKAVVFNFKKTKDKITGIETIRTPVHLAIPYPSVEGIVAILEAGGKGLDLLLESMETVTNGQARDLLYEDTSLTAATFPVEKVSWEFIANIPKIQRRGGGIPKETWEAFAKDYIEVMLEVTDKKLEQITNMAKILTDKLVRVRTNEPVLQLVVAQLAVYAEHSSNLGDYEECIAFLLNKAETFLNVSDEDLLANL